MRKMTEYIITGVKADDEKVFMQRIGEMLEKKELLEMLTDGVPTMVRITDADELLKYLLGLDSSYAKKACEIKKVYINENFRIIVEYKYLSNTYWFKTMEDKEFWEKDSWKFNNTTGKEKSNEMTDEFTVAGHSYSTNTIEVPVDTTGIEVHII
jgi:hypothetical protein